MREAPWLAVLLAISLLVSAASMLVLVDSYNVVKGNLRGLPSVLDDKVVVSRYVAAIDGFELRENITYRILKRGLSMVYRDFDTSLYYSGEPGPGPYIRVEGIVCPEGFYWYVYDAEKVLYTNAPPSAKNALEEKLDLAGARNEAGCYNPRGLEAGGEYVVEYRFLLHPEKAYWDGSSSGYTLSLARAGDHAEYRNLTIAPSGVTLVAVLPPQGDGSPSGAVARLDVLPKVAGVDLAVVTSERAPNGVKLEGVDSVEIWAASLASKRQTACMISWALTAVPLLFGALSPLIILAVYLYAGRELPPRTSIPEGMPPRTGEKPWEVAARYGTPGKLSASLIGAVLVDLLLRGAITVDAAGNVRIINSGVMDPVEHKIALAAESPGDAGSLLDSVAETVRRAAEEAVNTTYIRVLGAIIVVSLALPVLSIAISSIKLNLALVHAIPAMILPTIPFAAALLAPVHVLGRWKPGYRERAEAWRLFREGVTSRYSWEQAAVDPRICPYAIALLGFRGARRIMRALESATGVSLRAVWALAARAKRLRRAYIMYALRRSAGGGGGGGFGGGGAGAR